MILCTHAEQGIFDKLGRLFKSSKHPVASSEQKVRIGTRHTYSDHVDAAAMHTSLYLYEGISVTVRLYRLNGYAFLCVSIRGIALHVGAPDIKECFLA
jgi:hypothetical protein